MTMKRLQHFTMALLAAVSITFPLVTLPATAASDLGSDSACQDLPSTQKDDCLEARRDSAYTEECTDQTCDIVGKYLNPLINALSILAGIAVVVGILIGGIQYASSGGDPQKSATAKKHIRNSIVGLIGFFFLYAFLQFIIPGKGLFGV
jgi:Type IV secretion system pilin